MEEKEMSQRASRGYKIPILPRIKNDVIQKGKEMYQRAARYTISFLHRTKKDEIQKGKEMDQRASRRHKISFLPWTEKDEIQNGREVDHVVNIPKRNVEDPSGSQTNKSVNQIFAEDYKDLDNSSIKSCTIFKVYAWLRQSNPDAYIPKMVSIGPYHKEISHLHPMKKYKLLYLRRFLQRKEGLDEESCINELEEQKGQAIKCYEDIEDLDTNEFCRMLLLDGCFVVEFIRECHRIYPEGEDKIIKIDAHYIFRDLMLLENQLPFFVLDQLHHMTKQGDESSLAELVSKSFRYCSDLPTKTESSEGTAGDNIKHLLHVVHIRSCLSNPIKKSDNNDDRKWNKVLPNATELSEAGVRFKVSDTKSLFGIKFENGLMTIPCFEVEDGTETILRNLIAYEQQSIEVGPKYFSDFATFMDYLIDSEKDVNLLRKKGIIENRKGEDKEVASIFNKIGTGVSAYSGFYYEEECNKACQHCEKKWNRLQANLMHNYFSTPWVGASTIAAIILLILTAIQTILAIKGAIK